MGLKRKEKWESILATQIYKAKTIPFKYGVHDCATWVTETLKLYTNLEWEPSWANKKEAIKFQLSQPMEKTITEIIGEPRSNILLTQRGDLVQKDLGLNSAVGLCIGDKVVFLHKNGICYAELKDCIYSWRI